MNDLEKNSRVGLSETSVHSPDGLNGSVHDGTVLPLNDWPSEPKPLAGSRLINLDWDLAYDAVLVYIPLLLMVKTGLVIHAARIDAGKSGLIGSSVSGYTTNLIRVNTQVCSQTSLAIDLV